MNTDVDPDAERNFRTFIPQDLLDSYHLALGRFIQAFASLETGLNITLTMLLEEIVFPFSFYRKPLSPEDNAMFLSDPAVRAKSQMEASFDIQRTAALRATLKSKRMAELRSLIKDLMEIKKCSDEDINEARRIFEHIAHIHKMRDRLAHNGAVADMSNKDNWFYTTDIHTANLEEKKSFVYFKLDALDNMTRDLEVIPELLFELFNKEIKSALDSSPFMQTPDMLSYTENVRGPFLFSTSQLKVKKQVTK